MKITAKSRGKLVHECRRDFDTKYNNEENKYQTMKGINISIVTLQENGQKKNGDRHMLELCGMHFSQF